MINKMLKQTHTHTHIMQEIFAPYMTTELTSPPLFSFFPFPSPPHTQTYTIIEINKKKKHTSRKNGQNSKQRKK